MKRKKKKKGFCFVHMKPEELYLYSPEFYSTREEASKQLILDCYDIAEHNGYTKEQLFMPGVGEILNKIYMLWDNWTELEEDDEQDNEGRTEADPE